MKHNLLLLLVFLSLTGFGQALVIKGKVLDETGQGIPGANVLITGTSQGTVTDIEGNFSLEGVSPSASLSFSFVGYTTQVIQVGEQTTITVKLEPDVKSLDEVIVVGYGTTTSKELTGAVSVVSGKSLNALNPVRIDQALQGQAAGVQISTASGSPGGNVNIRIRGLSTNGNNQPLIIVDGIPYDDGLSSLNPADIESYNILKDASAAIYGVRAANGVILITTKQGKKSSNVNIEFSGYIGTQETTRKLDVLKAREYAILKNEAFAADGQPLPFQNVDLGTGTNWQDGIFQTAPIQNYNLSLSGGSDKSTYSIGGSYLDQKGIIGGDKSSYRRYNVRLNFNTEITKKLTLQNVLLYTNEKRSTIPEGGLGSVLFNTINASPAASFRQANGAYTYLEEFNDIINPLAQIANTYNEAFVNKLVGKQEFNYKFDKRFEATARINYSYANVPSKTFNPLVYYGVGKPQNTTTNPSLVPDSTTLAPGFKVANNNSVNQNVNTYYSYNFEAFVSYNEVFKEVHSVKGTAGISYIEQGLSGLYSTGFNIPYNSWEFADISLAQGPNYLAQPGSFQDRSRLQSIFVRGEYSYSGKYMLSAILRRDGSTRFGKNNRFGYFPSLSAAWTVSSEPFFKSKAIQFLKLRASYGVIGNDKIGNWSYRALLQGEGVYPFNDQLVSGRAIGVFGNQDLKWETTNQLNIGLDISLLNGKMDITSDFFIKRTYDLLYQPDVSAIIGSYAAGGYPPVVNGPEITNTGFEFLVNYNDKLGSDFNYNVGFNFSALRNEVTDLKGVPFIAGGSFGVGGSTATRMQVGQPIGSYFGFKTEGVYQTAEEIAARGVTQEVAKPGDLRYADLDGNKDISFSNNNDKTFLGSAIPKAIFGLNGGANYKGFDFSFSIFTSLGNKLLRNFERQQPLANQLSYKINRWTGPGSTNEHPRLTIGENRNNVISDYYVEDASFVRIKNVQIGYSLPESITKKIGARKVRFYVSANNLATFTKYRGFDPDFSSGDPLSGGIDYGAYPQARIIMGGFNLIF